MGQQNWDRQPRPRPQPPTPLRRRRFAFFSTDRFWKWFIFGVLVALIPIGFNFLYAMTVPNTGPLGTFLFSRGELLLLAVGLCANGLGDLALSGGTWSVFKIITAGASVAAIMLCSFYFTLVSGRYTLTEPADPGVVVMISLFLYVGSVVCSGIAVALSER